ncbi:MAG TPA: ferritin family protein [Dictyoglomaceae bacterium]|nr:ferritin family protein [Dictyoglomaceae bacterium]HOL38980.1 ferritin family protein [Dictyoglomaceae bacterium]HPP15844.1 ferritin family protein [Dictyoglomaceae bacterium]HPU42833.1 ferritin family protein [Dictyoglomaceae bacterium]
MVKLFSSADLLEMAIHIEEEGEKFYKMLEDKAEKEDLKRFFSFLAIEEKKHAITFKEIYKEIEKEGFISAYPDEEANKYLHAFVDSQVFINWDDMMKRSYFNIEEVLNIAINLEKDSILFYYELERFIPEKDKKILHEIIKQEKNHLLQLTEFKKSL